MLGELHGYAVTLDGNEQFGRRRRGARALARDARPPRARARSSRRRCYLEQPLPRGRSTLTTDVHALAHRRPPADRRVRRQLDAFPEAQRCGYSGVSSKNCKGLYKSLAQRAALRSWRATRRLVLSGEDLTTQAGLAVQQDLALAGALGITHVERNGHHYVDGFAGRRAGAPSRRPSPPRIPSLYDGRATAASDWRFATVASTSRLARRARLRFGAQPHWATLESLGAALPRTA